MEIEEPTISASKEHMKADVGGSLDSPLHFDDVPTPVEDDHPPKFDEPEVVDEGFWEGPQFTHVDVGETAVERSERHISPHPADTDAPTSEDPIASLIAEALEQHPPTSPITLIVPISTIELPDWDFFFDERGPGIAVLHENDGVSIETSHLSLSQNPPIPDHDVAPSSPVASSSSLAPSSPVVPGPSPRNVLQPVPMATLLSWKADLATKRQRHFALDDEAAEQDSSVQSGR
ncbi:hypothetical protein CPB85DRAFT_1292133 [Mucidula mucida]|nr:hypothetical protein CPB85DRAFT_1292133 [Mucidula mucida]